MRHPVCSADDTRLRNRETRHVPDRSAGAQQVIGYHNDRQEAFLSANGLTTTFFAFFFLCFLGVLYSVLRSAEGEGYGFAPVALAGG